MVELPFDVFMNTAHPGLSDKDSRTFWSFPKPKMIVVFSFIRITASAGLDSKLRHLAH
jgi:hypothetical protein